MDDQTRQVARDILVANTFAKGIPSNGDTRIEVIERAVEMALELERQLDAAPQQSPEVDKS